MNKHYIRTNDKSFVVKAFSNAFEQPLENDICVNEDGGRHYNLTLIREDGLPKYKYVDNLITETTTYDLTEELSILSDKLRILEIKSRLVEIKEFRDECFDRNTIDEEYEPYRIEAITLREELSELQ